MSVDLAVLIASTALGVLAVYYVVTPPAATRARPSVRIRPAPAISGSVAGIVVLAASGWLLPSFVVGGGVWWLVARASAPNPTSSSATTEALASWVENLRDVLLAGEQPIGAIAATVPTAAKEIRPAVRRLSTGLGHQSTQSAMRTFADEIDDPLGDLIAAGLAIAIERGGRTTAVLSAVAEQARSQADRHRLVEAERAPVRREVTLLTLMMGGLIVGLLVFGRAEYLAPYDEPAGQLFVSVVLLIYGALLVRVQRLARYPRPGRFLARAGSVTASHEVGTVR
ncbi:MAG: hypothetical protein AAGA42_06455 [Actinomycetota bacterium]